MTPSEQVTIEALSEVQQFRKDAGKEPAFATMDEILNSLRAEILESLSKLYREGKVEFHKTVNGVPMFGVKE